MRLLNREEEKGRCIVVRDESRGGFSLGFLPKWDSAGLVMGVGGDGADGGFV